MTTQEFLSQYVFDILVIIVCSLPEVQPLVLRLRNVVDKCRAVEPEAHGQDDCCPNAFVAKHIFAVCRERVLYLHTCRLRLDRRQRITEEHRQVGVSGLDVAPAQRTLRRRQNNRRLILRT